MYAHIKFLGMMAELYANEFEDFFHRLMCSRYPDFIDVRTAGPLGDMSADGLSLHSRKLYACYGPQTFDPSEVRRKLNKDLSGRLRSAAVSSTPSSSFTTTCAVCTR
ncbi:hypothetical protein NKH18_00770 [Streptomyces sp. M10(2022)]